MSTLSAIATRLALLRAELLSRNLDGFIVPRADAHQSEVTAPRDDCLAYVTGFTGSAGLALILPDKALLFVDGRYEIQVQREVDSKLFEVHHLNNAPVNLWLREYAFEGMHIGFDPMLINNELYDRVAVALATKQGALVTCSAELIDSIWPERPAAPLGPIHPMPVTNAGETSLSKRKRVSTLLQQAGAVALAENLPDNIAWLLNVRGSDVPMNPVPHSFLLMLADGNVEWFVDRRKLGNDLEDYELDGVRVNQPEEFTKRIIALAHEGAIMVDPQFAPVAAKIAVEGAGGTLIKQTSPITLLKAKKNQIELAGYRRCHIEDGAALTDFLAWVYTEGLSRENTANPLTELEAEAKLLEFRSMRSGFLEESFRSISASGVNAALCHYNASAEANAVIDSRLPYLIDSGGQYEDGTTDVTRTLFLGPASDEIRQTYTAVLKGFLALLMMKMPIGTQGHQLDAFARRPLWELGLDYDHGTGHGVGHNLLVHEYPHRFAKVSNPFGLEPGNIMTIEPGYYKANGHGMRIENQVEVVEISPGFCAFASLTIAPIDLSAVNLEELSDNEVLFLNEYHSMVRTTLLPLVKPETVQFLKRQTAVISVR
ncbi:aminopeptidase P family protein [Brucella sp. 21LCYQ03]|nr:aminopeptidase P family protein [Brucella sp. 21LCYQ03]